MWDASDEIGCCVAVSWRVIFSDPLNTGNIRRPPMNKPDISVSGGQLIDWAKEQQQLLYLDNARGERK